MTLLLLAVSVAGLVVLTSSLRGAFRIESRRIPIGLYTPGYGVQLAQAYLLIDKGHTRDTLLVEVQFANEAATGRRHLTINLPATITRTRRPPLGATGNRIHGDGPWAMVLLRRGGCHAAVMRRTPSTMLIRCPSDVTNNTSTNSFPASYASTGNPPTSCRFVNNDLPSAPTVPGRGQARAGRTSVLDGCGPFASTSPPSPARSRHQRPPRPRAPVPAPPFPGHHAPSPARRPPLEPQAQRPASECSMLCRD